MGVKKGKVTRKYLKFFKIVFDIRAPYHVILDGNFIFQALKYKIVIGDRLSKLLNEEEIKLRVQRSVLDELKSVGEKAKASYEFASKLCTVVEDGDIEGDSPASKLVAILENLVAEEKNSGGKSSSSSSSSSSASAAGGGGSGGGKHKTPKYLVATQDKDLRGRIARIPGVPLLYLNKVSIVLEPPSDTSRNFGESVEREKVSAQEFELNVANSLKQSKSKRSIIGIASKGGNIDGLEEEADNNNNNNSTGETKIRRKRKATSSNPLSSKMASKDSNNTKRRKLSKFRSKGSGA